VEKEMKLLKKCGGCGVVLYCSPECQKISWRTTHKFSCVTNVIPLPSMGIKDFDKRFNKVVDRWMHEWRGILEMYSVIALDLANNPGRHVTHAMCMELKYTGSSIPARTFELMGGKVCDVEGILSRQPGLKVLRDPPSLAGQRVRCVMVFHFDSENTTVARCKVRAQAWTDPALHTRLSLDNETSAILAGGVFHVAKMDFEGSNPDELRAGARLNLQPSP